MRDNGEVNKKFSKELKKELKKAKAELIHQNLKV